MQKSNNNCNKESNKMKVDLDGLLYLVEEDEMSSGDSGYCSDQDDFRLEGSITSDERTEGSKTVQWTDPLVDTTVAGSPVLDNDLSSLSSPPEAGESPTSSSSESSGSDSVDDDDEDIEENLQFLNEKCEILKRFSAVMQAEELYDASIAKNIPKSDISSIWKEAKKISENLSKKKRGRRAAFAPSVKQADNTLALKQSPRKKARIDITSVKCVSSKSYMKAQKECSQTAFVNEDRSWMVKALQQIREESAEPAPHNSFGATSRKDNTTGSIYLDSLEQHLPGRVSADEDGMNNNASIGTTMEDALCITNIAQLISQATPPFLVVHANKSFFGLSQLSYAEVIGKPIAEMVHVSQTVTQVLSGQDCNAKDLQVKPVRNQDGKLSHVLVQVHGHANLVHIPLSATIALSHEPHPRVLVGTVG